MLSALMCFNSSFTVIRAEEETSAEEQGSQEVIEEEKVQEVLEEQQIEEKFEEEPGITEEGSAETVEEESTEEGEDNGLEILPDEIVTNLLEDEVETIEQESVEDQEEIAEEELQEEVIAEEGQDYSELYATPASSFTYTISNEEVTITQYTGGNYTIVIIPSEINGYSVTSIGSKAFYCYNNLTSITIPDSVTSIGSFAFSGCSSLTSITIPDSVTSIEAYAFQDCSSLTSITIPKGLTNIGGGIFSGCSNLTRIKIPDNVTNIDDWAFDGCSSLTSLTIPEGVTNIGEGAFCECSSLTRIIIPGSVTRIGYAAFQDCSSLTSITIPEGVTNIDDQAFSGCTSLTSFTIPEGVTSIREYTFYNCTSLTSITIPDSVTSIIDDAFKNCSGLKEVHIHSLEDWCNISFSNLTANPLYYAKSLYLEEELLTEIVIPKGVTSIGNYAFSGCSSLTSITIPDSVTSIGNSAFSGCSSLTSITIPDSVTSIGNSAFSGCSSLTSIMIPDSVTSIGNSAFSGCSSLTSITIPDSVTSIGNSAFSGCSSLTSITIPDSVTSIGYSAFRSCTSLTSFTIPEGVTSIREYTFYNCTSLTSITIPDSVTSIIDDAFKNCSGLKEVHIHSLEAWCNISFSNLTANPLYYAKSLYLDDELLTEIVIPEGVESINNYAFFNCSSLASLTIPDSVTSIGDSAFSGCSSLTNIMIPDSVTSIGDYAFSGCSSLTSITIPDSVTSIGEWAFRSCSSLTSITIPEGVTSIGSYAFSGCNGLKTAGPIGSGNNIKFGWTTAIPSNAFEGCSTLTSITIPEGITSIGNSAFRNCSSLTSITIPNSVTAVEKGAFYGCNNLKTVIYRGTPEDWNLIKIDEHDINGSYYIVPIIKAKKTYVIPVRGINIIQNEYSVELGNSIQIEKEIVPDEASNKNVIWVSDNPEIAAIDENGLVTGLKEGTTVITATAEDGGYADQCSVTIYAIHPERISVNEHDSISEIEYGKTGTIQITFEPANTTNQNLTWTSSDESIAKVDENGKVTAVGEGKVTITATSEDGGFTASKEINVFCVHVESISFEEETVEVIAGKSISTTIVYKPENASNRKVIYTSDHPEIATVSEEGAVAALSEGTAVITATSKDGNKTAQITVRVLPDDLYVRGIEDTYEYQGTAIKPVPAVYDSSVLLIAGKDYTVTYKNNTNAYTYEGEDRSSFIPAKGDKTPYILITGKGNYSGKTYVPFSITKVDLNDPDQVYIENSITLKSNGKVQRPVPVITFNGKTVSSKEYTLTYLEKEDQDSAEIALDKKTGPKAAGTYTIRIEGKDKNFTGTKDVTLTISDTTEKEKAVALSKAITITAESEEYDGNEKLNALIDSKPAYEGIITEDDYTVTYTKNVNAGTATVTATGKGIYTGTVKKTFKITPRLYEEHKDEFTFDVSDTVYSKGGAIPEVHVFWNDKELTAGTDYTLKYTNNKKVGIDGSAKITFKGNFKGSYDQSFRFAQEDTAAVNITAKDLVYKKGKYQSTPVLTDTDGKKLKAGTDYEKTISYTTVDGKELPAVVEAGTTVKVTVTGKGNYTGTAETYYRILEAGKDISKATFKIANKEYTGSPVELTEADITATINKTTGLELGTHYEIAGYTNNINKGTAKVTFRGINGYGGTKTVSFKIGQRSIVDYWQGVKNFFARMF